MQALALALTLAFAGCGTVSDEAAAPPGPSPPPSRAGSAGVTVELPPDWYSTPGLDGNVTDPLARVVVASSPILPAASDCQTSSYAFADDAVALVLVEWQGSARGDSSNPPRPAHFTPEDLGIQRGLHECYRGRFGSAFFADEGRQFGAYVFVGDRAPPELVDEVCAVLDSLDVTPGRART